MTSTLTNGEATTFLIVMGVIILAGIVSTIYFFRRGGVYNPSMPSLDTHPEDLPFIPSSVPAPDKTHIATTFDETTPTEPILAPKATLENLCLAIKQMEGANPANNNAGNVRFYKDGYLPKYGIVGKSKGGFAMFSTYALGWMYLREMIKGQIKKNPNQTLLQFMQRYAPVEDKNDPVAYAHFIAVRLGVSISFRMGDLVLV